MDQIKERLKTDDEFMCRSLITLYRFQTNTEKETLSSHYRNNMGFNALDAQFLSSVAEFLLDRGYLTDKQKQLVRSKITKYSSQIRNVCANGDLAEVSFKEPPTREVVDIRVDIIIRKSEKCNGDNSLFVSFPYDNKLVSMIRNFPTRYWNKETKEWELPLNKKDELVHKLNELRIPCKVIDESVNSERVAPMPKYDFKTNPFNHQVEGFKYGMEHNRWLLGDEQGLGKTKQVIDIAVAKKAQHGYKHCLIICGVNGLKWNWVNEIHTHSNEGAWILGQRTTNGKTTVGGNEAKLADLRAISNLDDYFIITNIESLRNESITGEIIKLCKEGTIGMIAADEVHKMKNPSSQQGKAFLKLQAETMIAMTGTPLMNTPMDIYIILKWLGFEKHSFYAFKNHYCILGGFGGYQIVGYRNLEELQENLDSVMLRRLKKQVLDLPDKLYVDEYVEMTPKQEQIYREVTADIKANIDEIKMANNPLAELIRLRQATGYTGILSSTIQESAKLDRMEELVEDAISNDKKIVIFSNWTQMTDEIFARMLYKHNYNPVRITGQTSDVDRQANVNKFQNDNNCKVIIGTIGAMGTGLTLTAGTVEIFLDEPWNMALKEQCVDRCHRIGQKNTLTIYTLMCKDTIDQRIHELVEKKGAIAELIVDGCITKTDAREVLDFLLN